MSQADCIPVLQRDLRPALRSLSGALSRLRAGLLGLGVLCAAAAPLLAAGPTPSGEPVETGTSAAAPLGPSDAAPGTTAFALRDGDRVVFYGDSITQDGGYARFVEEYVTTRFPSWNVTFENAGVGGDTVRGGWAGPIEKRLERDVIAFRPTLVTIMLGMNDGGYKPFDPTTLSAFSHGYRAIVERLRQALPGLRITIIRSSPFDDVSRRPQFAPGYDDALRRLGCYATSLARGSDTTADFRTPLNAGLRALVATDPALAQQLLPDRVHPSAAGHLLMGATLLRAWNAPALVSRVELDARTRKVVGSERTRVSDLGGEAGTLRWTALDEALPLPLSFDDAQVDLAQKAGARLEDLDRELLVVHGLGAGRYELRIDGQAVGSFESDALAKGVDLAPLATPQRSQAFGVRWSVADSHELQRLRRRFLAGAPEDAATARTVEALSAADTAARQARRESARPKPRRYELVPMPAPGGERPPRSRVSG